MSNTCIVYMVLYYNFLAANFYVAEGLLVVMHCILFSKFYS
jgi:hypothetical protein